MRKASLALALSEGVLSPPILIYKYKKNNLIQQLNMENLMQINKSFAYLRNELNF